jgi:hypothetical protein
MSRTTLAKIVRVAVYAVLVVSAGTTFLLDDRLWQAARRGTLPTWVALLPVCAFTGFVVIYSVDRLLLVKRRNYPTGRAFFQIVFALLFIGLLWPEQASRFQEARRVAHGDDRAIRLLKHRDPDVRAIACELLGLRADVDVVDAITEMAEKDRSADVRQACTVALERLRAGAPLDPDSMGL